MMHTILRFLNSRWFISQNIANFLICKKPLNFQKLSGKFSILEVFKYSTFG